MAPHLWRRRYHRRRRPVLGSYPGLPPHARQGSRGFYIITVRDDAKPGYMLVGTNRSKYRFGPKEAA